VYEQAPQIGEVGAGIGLWPGALKSLREIGIADWFWDLPVSPFRWARTATPAGEEVLGFDVQPMTGGLGYVVRRPDLLAALSDSLAPGMVLTGKRLTALHRGDTVTLAFADGTSAQADLVIGADGLHSVVRREVVNDPAPRYSGETCWRGITGFRVADPGLMQEVQGGGRRGAVHALGDDAVYWWTTARVPVGSPAGSKVDLVAALSDWQCELPAAIEATDETAILHNDLFDRDPVTAWSKGPVTLLGDAAHPTTPNLGLGGCMAIEDALVLARALAGNRAYGQALAQYEYERHPRTARVVRMSRLMGRAGSIRNPVLARGWRAANAATPARVGAAMLAREVTYDPGPLQT
jgi:2-polyprenyl-6-methoxyphenol hydroxylase-like FAD-dependent oxidoreductase